HEALEIAQNEECDIILMDLQMPGLGGVAAADQLIQGWQTDRRHPSIIAVTADNSPERRVLCRAIGMSGFIAKPYDANTLYDALQQVIIRGHCWTDGPPRRVFNMARFLEVVESGAELRRLEFEDWAGSMPDALCDLFDSVHASGAGAHRPRIEELRSDAATMGFVNLEAVLLELHNEKTRLKASWLDAVLDDFDLCLMAARESIQLASECLMDCV
ncbi:MAG: response regulator, partial [Verrucomicrobiaceae bacterium]